MARVLAATQASRLLLLQLIATACMLSPIGCSSAIARDASDININKEQPKVEQREFDPEQLPDPPPPIPPGLKAATQHNFYCSAFCSAKYLDEGERTSVGVHATVRITSMNLTLTLPIIVWLPHGASRNLQDHEAGHVALSTRVFKNADKIAGEIAEPIVGQTFDGTAATLSEARADAIHSAVISFCKQYHARTKEVAKQMDDYYDELTNHGRNGRPSEEAVKETMDKFGF